MVDGANISLAEILPISGNNCAEKGAAAINNDHRNFMTCEFFYELELHEMLGFELTF